VTLITNQGACRLLDRTVGRKDELAGGCGAGQVACSVVVQMWGEDS
jgi:hypothetical protein